MSKRIYIVVDSEASTQRLVRAASQAQAVSYCVNKRYSAEVASQQALVDLASNGVKVEEAGEE